MKAFKPTDTNRLLVASALWLSSAQTPEVDAEGESVDE